MIINYHFFIVIVRFLIDTMHCLEVYFVNMFIDAHNIFKQKNVASNNPIPKYFVRKKHVVDILDAILF